MLFIPNRTECVLGFTGLFYGINVLPVNIYFVIANYNLLMKICAAFIHFFIHFLALWLYGAVDYCAILDIGSKFNDVYKK